MYDKAFDILGIEPTNDLRVIRNAFVRLARIYHPDRFAGLPDDVRVEAERRMKQATVAYEHLRAARRSAAVTAGAAKASRTKDHDPWDEARRAREAILARRAEQERSRSRWLLWEELERQARERADSDAHFASVVVDDLSVRRARSEGSRDDPAHWSLTRRLEQAREARRDVPATTRRSS